MSEFRGFRLGHGLQAGNTHTLSSQLQFTIMLALLAPRPSR
jgi:hypothetical protein